MTSLEFMPNAAAAIKEAARVSAKGIVFGLMNKSSPVTLRKKILAAMKERSFYSDANFYSISKIKRLLFETFGEGYSITFWSTTVFPKFLRDWESSVFPFGAFLGLAVKLRDDL
jgi:hypothetical protein